LVDFFLEMIKSFIIVFALLIVYGYSSSSGHCGDSVTWTLDDHGLLRVQGNGEMGKCDIPDLTKKYDVHDIVIENYVTSIANSTFAGCLKLRSVTISDSVVTIGDDAFNNEWTGEISVTSLTMGNSVKTIGDHAFYKCSMKEIVIGKSVETIGNGAFAGCIYVTSVTFLGDSLTTIGRSAFAACKLLKGIVIPSSVTSMGPWVFRACNELRYAAFLGTKDPGIVSRGVFQECRNLGKVCVSSAYDASSFCGYSGLSPLEECGVAPNATGKCGQGTKWFLNFDTGVLKVEGKGYMTDACDLNTDQKSHVTALVVKKGVKSIAPKAFMNFIHLKSVTIPDSVEEIGDWAFYRSGKIRLIKLPDSVVSIGDYAFEYSNLYTIQFGFSLKKIGKRAFHECRNLPLIILPSSVTSIGSNAFSNCTQLTSVTYFGDEDPGVGSTDVFKPCPKLSSVCVLDLYKSATFCGLQKLSSLDQCKVGRIFTGDCGKGFTWVLDNHTHVLRVQGKGDMRKPCHLTKAQKNGVESIVFEDGILSIPDNAFSDFPHLYVVNFSNTVQKIGSHAFDGNDIVRLKIPSSVKSIGDCAFCGCERLRRVEFSDGLETIGKYAFSGTWMEDLVIPRTVKHIGYAAFYHCPDLDTVAYLGTENPGSDSDAFDGCNGLKYICVPYNYQEHDFCGWSRLVDLGQCGLGYGRN